MQITRKKLVKIAFKVLKKYPDVSGIDRKHLLFMACTIDKVALGAWAIDENCGCLVGSMYLHRGIDRPRKPNGDLVTESLNIAIYREARGDSLEQLGRDFDTLLTKAVESPDDFDPGHGLAIEVID